MGARCLKFLIEIHLFFKKNIVYFLSLFVIVIRFRIKKIKKKVSRNISINILSHKGKKLLERDRLVRAIHGRKRCEEEQETLDGVRELNRI